ARMRQGQERQRRWRRALHDIDADPRRGGSDAAQRRLDAVQEIVRQERPELVAERVGADDRTVVRGEGGALGVEDAGFADWVLDQAVGIGIDRAQRAALQENIAGAEILDIDEGRREIVLDVELEADAGAIQFDFGWRQMTVDDVDLV